MGVFVGEKMIMYSCNKVSVGLPYVTIITTCTNEFVDYMRLDDLGDCVFINKHIAFFTGHKNQFDFKHGGIRLNKLPL